MNPTQMDTASSATCFTRAPIKEIEGIPVFSSTDEYTENYHTIATDHLNAMTENRDNPWIGNEDWQEMEAGTLGLVLKYAQLAKPAGPLKLLDIGVGLGRLLGKIGTGLQGTAVDLHGMDIALPYLVRAKQKGLNVILSKIEDIPYQHSTFDIVTCTDVLEHVLDLNLCVGKCLSVLKPGGFLIIRVPNREDLSGYLRPDYPYKMVHLRNFDQHSLELLFTRIFHQEALEFLPGLFMPAGGLLKYRLPGRGYDFLLFKAIAISKKWFSASFYRKLLEWAFHSVEINMVIRKRPENEA